MGTHFSSVLFFLYSIIVVYTYVRACVSESKSIIMNGLHNGLHQIGDDHR